MTHERLGGGLWVSPGELVSTSVPRAVLPQVSHLESWCHTNVINKAHAVLPGGNGDDEEDNDGNGGRFNHCYCNSQTRALVVIQQGHVYEGVLRLNVKIIPR